MDYFGLLNICKVPGMSSHEVVNQVRRIAGMKRVGHAGTLDPAACGVLPVCLGKAARLSDYISGGCKSYRAEITFGITTTGGDAEGLITGRTDASQLSEAQVVAAMAQFTGTFQQQPPMQSAVWIGGQRAYDMALRGEKVDMPFREVTVTAFTPVRFTTGAHPSLLADIACSRGTYIRSLAHDLGMALGVGATLSFLARTAVGGCKLEDTVTVEELVRAGEAGQFAQWVRCPDYALEHIPAFIVPPEEARYIQGAPIAIAGEPGLYRVYLDDTFIGLGRWEEGVLRNVVNLT